MKATAVIKGDHTVGIPDYGFVIDFGEGFEFADALHRGQVRMAIWELAQLLYDEMPGDVWFDDDPEESESG